MSLVDNSYSAKKYFISAGTFSLAGTVGGAVATLVIYIFANHLALFLFLIPAGITGCSISIFVLSSTSYLVYLAVKFRQERKRNSQHQQPQPPLLPHVQREPPTPPSTFSCIELNGLKLLDADATSELQKTELSQEDGETVAVLTAMTLHQIEEDEVVGEKQDAASEGEATNIQVEMIDIEIANPQEPEDPKRIRDKGKGPIKNEEVETDTPVDSEIFADEDIVYREPRVIDKEIKDKQKNIEELKAKQKKSKNATDKGKIDLQILQLKMEKLDLEYERLSIYKKSDNIEKLNKLITHLKIIIRKGEKTIESLQTLLSEKKTQTPQSIIKKKSEISKSLDKLKILNTELNIRKLILKLENKDEITQIKIKSKINDFYFNKLRYQSRIEDNIAAYDDQIQKFSNESQKLQILFLQKKKKKIKSELKNEQNPLIIVNKKIKTKKLKLKLLCKTHIEDFSEYTSKKQQINNQIALLTGEEKKIQASADIDSDNPLTIKKAQLELINLYYNELNSETTSKELKEQAQTELKKLGCKNLENVKEIKQEISKEIKTIESIQKIEKLEIKLKNEIDEVKKLKIEQKINQIKLINEKDPKILAELEEKISKLENQIEQIRGTKIEEKYIQFKEQFTPLVEAIIRCGKAALVRHYSIQYPKKAKNVVLKETDKTLKAFETAAGQLWVFAVDYMKNKEIEGKFDLPDIPPHPSPTTKLPEILYCSCNILAAFFDHKLSNEGFSQVIEEQAIDALFATHEELEEKKLEEILEDIEQNLTGGKTINPLAMIQSFRGGKMATAFWSALCFELNLVGFVQKILPFMPVDLTKQELKEITPILNNISPLFKIFGWVLYDMTVGNRDTSKKVQEFLSDFCKEKMGDILNKCFIRGNQDHISTQGEEQTLTLSMDLLATSLTKFFDAFAEELALK